MAVDRLPRPSPTGAWNTSPKRELVLQADRAFDARWDRPSIDGLVHRRRARVLAGTPRRDVRGDPRPAFRSDRRPVDGPYWDVARGAERARQVCARSAPYPRCGRARVVTSSYRVTSPVRGGGTQARPSEPPRRWRSCPSSLFL